jgi:hypothetical protein
LFLSCLKATRLIEKRLAYRLNPLERLQLHTHKLMCKACQLYDQQSSFLDSAIQKRIKEKALSNEPLKLKILQKIDEEGHL